MRRKVESASLIPLAPGILSNRLDRVIIEQVNPHTKLQALRAHNFRATPGVAYLRVMHLREQVDNQPAPAPTNN